MNGPEGKRYFQCQPKYGGFVRVANVTVGDFPEEGFSDDEIWIILFWPRVCSRSLRNHFSKNYLINLLKLKAIHFLLGYIFFGLRDCTCGHGLL